MAVERTQVPVSCFPLCSGFYLPDAAPTLCKARAAPEPHCAPVTPVTQPGAAGASWQAEFPVPKPRQSGVNEYHCCPVCTHILPNLHQEHCSTGNGPSHRTVAHSSVLIQLSVPSFGPLTQSLSSFRKLWSTTHFILPTFQSGHQQECKVEAAQKKKVHKIILQ